jgi:hypothetical protein
MFYKRYKRQWNDKEMIINELMKDIEGKDAKV